MQQYTVGGSRQLVYYVIDSNAYHGESKNKKMNETLQGQTLAYQTSQSLYDWNTQCHYLRWSPQVPQELI
jgi:hypothetical protein